MKRAAVLIGVHKVAELEKLNAVLDGVDRMEKWALAQGMERDLVKTITDKDDLVKAGDIEETVSNIVKTDGLQQLIIYFAVHGVNVSYNEYWLLSRALESVNESVNVSASVTLARNCGLEHVVFLSDACRSVPKTIREQGTTGTVIFPPPKTNAKKSFVDVFYATALGEPALEIKETKKAAGQFRAVYTDSMLEAFNGVHKDVLKMDDDLGQKVVRPWPLHDFLTDDVPLRVFEMTQSFKRTQLPDSTITSRPDSFWLSDVSKASSPDPTSFVAPPENRAASAVLRAEINATSDLVREAIDTENMMLLDALTNVRAAAVRRRSSVPDGTGDSTDFALDVAEAATELSRPFGHEVFESRCGFNVRGDGFVDVVGNVHFELKDEGSTVGIHSNDEAVSVLLVLDSGFGALVAAYPGFIGNLTMGEQSLNALHYDPSKETMRRDVFEENENEIRTLRAIAAAASQKGVFRLHTGEADKMARRMQLAKGIDPSLALYAAHAYTDQGNDRYLQEMENYLGNDLGKVPFDVALLAERLKPVVIADNDQILPFLPMLSQTWALLPAYNIVLPAGLENIQHHLVHSSLWSLFKPSGVELIRQAFNSGAVK